MTKAIWKYPLPIGVEFTLEMPEGAEAMTVQLQPGHELDNQPVLWALVDPDKPKEKRLFRIYGTGHAIEGPVDLFGYLGTWQSASFVWHLFEVLPVPNKPSQDEIDEANYNNSLNDRDRRRVAGAARVSIRQCHSCGVQEEPCPTSSRYAGRDVPHEFDPTPAVREALEDIRDREVTPPNARQTEEGCLSRHIEDLRFIARAALERMKP